MQKKAIYAEKFKICNWASPVSGRSCSLPASPTLVPTTTDSCKHFNAHQSTRFRLFWRELGRLRPPCLPATRRQAAHPPPPAPPLQPTTVSIRCALCSCPRAPSHLCSEVNRLNFSFLSSSVTGRLPFRVLDVLACC